MSLELFNNASMRRGCIYLIPEEVKTSATKYSVGERIAQGGNAVVHECTSSRDGNNYAIKFQLDLRANRVERFQRELELTKNSHHDHLIRYIDHGIIAGDQSKNRARKKKPVQIPFLVMELAENNLFSTLNDTAQRSPYEVYIAQFKGLAAALGEIHDRALHRDIKPHNILIIGERWVLSDFGLCAFLDSEDETLTPDWEIIGPRFWMSPEANNKAVGYECEINKASDVFQLASVFWYVVTKRHPTGILRKEDWTGPSSLFEPLFFALQHDVELRPKNGKVFAESIEAAVLS